MLLHLLDYFLQIKYRNLPAIYNVNPATNALVARLFPNPANDVFVVQLNIPQGGNVSLDVYNSLGQHVTNLKQSFLNKGEHKLPFNNSSTT